eukprot:TRINITY_DN6196_c0_g1_i1.p2 TRINITY_DN6196_c0_g1~~TRINITY_DN6196_c0_g1_i1.p2  ORF type:complete len:110 (+),score=16.07 TRINITY_DN6196_c0_g1_i1:305-634(+)
MEARRAHSSSISRVGVANTADGTRKAPGTAAAVTEVVLTGARQTHGVAAELARLKHAGALEAAAAMEAARTNVLIWRTAALAQIGSWPEIKVGGLASETHASALHKRHG